MYRVLQPKCLFRSLFMRMGSTAAAKLTPKELECLAYDRARKVAVLLNCSHSYAFQLVSKYKHFVTKDWDVIEKTIFFLDKKFDSQDVLLHHNILKLDHISLAQRYAALEEIGITSITVKTMTSFQQIVSMTIQELKKARIITPSKDPVYTMLQALNCDREIADKIRQKLVQQNYLTDMPLSDIHQTIRIEYLSWRLGCQQEVLISKFKRENKLIDSFRNLKECLDIIFRNAEVSQPLLRRNSFFLNTGADVDCLEERSRHMQSLKIIREQILKYPRMLTLSSQGVKQRLEQIEPIPELYVLRSCPGFLKVVYNFEKAKRNLDTLKSSGYTAISVNLLLKANLENHLMSRRGDWCMGNECVYYFSCLFRKTPADIREKLKLHPNWQRISLCNSQIVTEALLKRGVSVEQLWNSLYIVLYDCTLVVHYFDGLKNRPELQPFDEWKNVSLVLDLVVYYIEKEHNVSGSGMFYSPVLTATEIDVPAVCYNETFDLPLSSEMFC